jgi:hypothetical protein
MNIRKTTAFAATIQAISSSLPEPSPGSTPGLFRQARRHEVVSQSPGHYLIRLRQRHVPESSLGRHRKI